MNILIEKKIGDAQISIRGGRHYPTAKEDFRDAARFPASGIPTAADIEAFLTPLRNLAAADLDALVDTLPPTPLPQGYRHFRLFNAQTGDLWGKTFVVEEGRALTLHSVLFIALNHPTMELANWDAAEWLPDTIPGVLDIEIAFVAVPRTRKPFRLTLRT